MSGAPAAECETVLFEVLDKSTSTSEIAAGIASPSITNRTLRLAPSSMTIHPEPPAPRIESLLVMSVRRTPSRHIYGMNFRREALGLIELRGIAKADHENLWRSTLMQPRNASDTCDRLHSCELGKASHLMPLERLVTGMRAASELRRPDCYSLHPSRRHAETALEQHLSVPT